MKVVTISILLFFSLQLVAEHAAPPTRHEAHASIPPGCEGKILSDEEFKSLIKDYYRPFMREMKRKVYVYHYGYRTPRYPNGAPAKDEDGEPLYDDSTPVSSQPDTADYDGPIGLNPVVTMRGKTMGLAQHYFQQKSRAHFAYYGGWEWGRGLYTAMDPVSSIQWSHGLLLRVGIPAGMKYLDLRVFPVSAFETPGTRKIGETLGS